MLIPLHKNKGDILPELWRLNTAHSGNPDEVVEPEVENITYNAESETPILLEAEAES